MRVVASPIFALAVVACTSAPGLETDSETDSDPVVDTDEGPLVGKTYAIDLSTGRVVSPEGLGDLLGPFMTRLLFGVEGQGADALWTVGAMAVLDSEPVEQDLCLETVAFPEADFSADPAFQIDATGTATRAYFLGVPILLDDLRLSGTFSADGGAIEGMRIVASVETHALAPVIDETCVSTSSDYPACLQVVCDLMAVAGGCVACADGTGDHCLLLDIDQLDAPGVSGRIEPRAASQIAADSACDGR